MIPTPSPLPHSGPARLASALNLPPLDSELSPCTGLTRTHWEAVADHLLLALRPYASVGHALLSPPGKPSRSGSLSDGFEGFARSFLLAAGLIRARGDADPHSHGAWYAAGLAAGVDPDATDAWPRPSERGQAKVEACALALALDATRAQVWDRLEAEVRSRLVDWFAEIIGTTYPDNNWVWFRIIVLTFLRSVDARFTTGERAGEVLADFEHDLALHETFVREGGWFADGPERSFDHYADWVFALLPTLWARMEGAREGGSLDRPGLLGADERARHRGRLEAYLPDALGLLGADGSPLVQGRSLVYRMASAGVFWAGAIAQTDVVTPGLLRRAASGTLEHFLAHGVPDRDGLLNLGWFDAFEPMAQAYSGPGSPYWASMGFAGLLLPPDHPVWTAREELLPVECGDGVSVLSAPGWIVSRTRSDGIVRVLNHGTDHATPGSAVPDDPLYARLGYSTATSPQMVPSKSPSTPHAEQTGFDAPAARTDVEGPVQPRDATVGLVDPVGGWSHRTGFETLALRVEGQSNIGVGLSRQWCRWPENEGADSGAEDCAETPEVIVATISRGAQTVVAARTRPVPGGRRYRLGIAGWPLSASVVEEGPVREGKSHGGLAPSHTVGTVDERVVSVRRVDGTTLHSALRVLHGSADLVVHRDSDVSPLGPDFAVPLAIADADAQGGPLVVLMTLEGAHAGPRAAECSVPRVQCAGSMIRVEFGIEDGASGDADAQDRVVEIDLD